MHHFRHYHFHLPKIREELKEIYLNMVIQFTAFSMLGIFVPAYLLDLGYDLSQVVLWAIGIYIIWAIFSFVTPLVVQRFGYKTTVLLRTPLVLAFFALLYALQFQKIPLYWLSIVTGLMWTFYWNPINSFFVSHSDAKHKGIETGFLVGLPKVMGIVGPLVGALILSSAGGMTVLLVLVGGMFLASTIPLFWSPDEKAKTVNWSKFLSTEELHFSFIFFEGIILTGLHFALPLYVFIELGGFNAVGIVGALFALASAVFGILVGRSIDKGNKSFFKLGVITTSLLTFLLFAFPPGNHTFLIAFLVGVSTSPIHVSMSTHFFKLSKKLPIIGVTLREVFLCLGRLTSLSILLITGLSFELMFLAVGVLILPLLLLDI